MGWICSPSEDNCLVKFYSISEDIKIVSDAIFGFIGNLSPGLISFTLIITLGVIAIVLMYSVKNSINSLSNI